MNFQKFHITTPITKMTRAMVITLMTKGSNELSGSEINIVIRSGGMA
jgi:hypothetical protein